MSKRRAAPITADNGFLAACNDGDRQHPCGLPPAADRLDSPSGQRHLPPLQVFGATHTVPHSPQLLLSLLMSLHTFEPGVHSGRLTGHVQSDATHCAPC